MAIPDPPAPASAALPRVGVFSGDRREILKAIVIVTMVADHVGAAWLDDVWFFRSLLELTYALDFGARGR